MKLYFYISPRLLAVVLFAWLCSLSLFAQSPRSDAAAARALGVLRARPAAWGLEADDVADVKITDTYRTEHSDITHVWVQQQYRGIPIHGALLGIHLLPDGQALHTPHRFVAGVSRHIAATAPALRPAQAVEQALYDLGLTDFPVPPLREKQGDHTCVLEGGSVSRVPMAVSLCYYPVLDGQMRLAWYLNIAPPATSEHWHYAIDAVSGAVLNRHNVVLSCQMPNAFHGNTNGMHTDCEVADPVGALHAAAASGSDPAPVQAPAYRVFALPVESPVHGGRTLVNMPAHPASPYGWHDTNGATGPEYTYTRGNNTWAYEDSGNTNSGDPARSAAGGSGLLFDFPYNPALAPADNKDAAVTNLFYTTNMMHDFLYVYGFDEQAGNYQENNYGKPGFANDLVRAEAIDGASENNALFEPTADGFQGKMELYRWSRAGGRLLQVNAPAGPLQGSYPVATTLGWGGTITTVPLTADVVPARDNSAAGPLVCNALTMDLKGKIALVNRGTCTFREKAYNVQQAGAVACVICNTGESQISMSPGTSGLPVTIPVVMLRKSDCDRLRAFAGNGLNISLVQPPPSGPDYLDGSFDNGIIAHEYAHGLSNRLTGGPNTAICLQNAEQMGEGWSDFFALAVTVVPGSKGETPRGIGNYGLREQPDGTGIRTYPYSTDMRVNPLTYEFVIDNNTIHNVGEVWAAMLWDLYWAMVNRYGYNANWNDLNSGNARAIRLVMDGMKLQPCNPGFTDGRDAILRADTLLYGAANSELIWQVFARRGLGFSASQGTSYSITDGLAAFDLPPAADRRMTIEKTVPLNAEPGEVLPIELVLTNRTESVLTDVRVEDEVPAGLKVLSGSGNYTLLNGKILWQIPSIAVGQRVTVQYRAQTDAVVGSVRLFKDDMEKEDPWLSSNNAFILQNLVKKTGSFAWKVTASEKASDEGLELDGNAAIALTGQKPALRFWHRYETETGTDGGIVEVRTTDSGSVWQPLMRQQGLRHTYPRRLQYRTFGVPDLYAFTGNSKGWVQSYFDLSEYAGKSILLRYRFGTNEGNAAVISDGWYIDATECLDLFRYDGTACATYNNSTVCTKAAEGGTIMGFPVVSVQPASASGFSVRAAPNPVGDRLYVSLLSSSPLSGLTRFLLFDLNGRVVTDIVREDWGPQEAVYLDMHQIPAGMYVLKVENAQGVFVQKIAH